MVDVPAILQLPVFRMLPVLHPAAGGAQGHRFSLTRSKDYSRGTGCSVGAASNHSVRALIEGDFRRPCELTDDVTVLLNGHRHIAGSDYRQNAQRTLQAEMLPGKVARSLRGRICGQCAPAGSPESPR